MSPSVDAVQSGNPTLGHPLDQPNHPFNKIWRGSKDGSVGLRGIPRFEDPYEEREWIKVCSAHATLGRE